ncbi:MAG: hypothetical protein GY862_37310 [Gammaproteobacteria bacterium]|nr:hypothetical protein [Gammaproteobacteria bacterium]
MSFLRYLSIMLIIFCFIGTGYYSYAILDKCGDPVSKEVDEGGEKVERTDAQLEKATKDAVDAVTQYLKRAHSLGGTISLIGLFWVISFRNSRTYELVTSDKLVFIALLLIILSGGYVIRSLSLFPPPPELITPKTAFIKFETVLIMAIMIAINAVVAVLAILKKYPRTVILLLLAYSYYFFTGIIILDFPPHKNLALLTDLEFQLLSALAVIVTALGLFALLWHESELEKKFAKEEELKELKDAVKEAKDKVVDKEKELNIEAPSSPPAPEKGPPTQALLQGMQEGLKHGMEDGFKKGFEKGKAEGFEEGREQGFASGKEEGLRQSQEENPQQRQARDIEKAKQESREEGEKQGMEEGRKQGLKEGRGQGVKQGVEEGLKQGLEQGLKQGREEGLARGRQEANAQTTQIVRRLLEAEVALAIILRATGLSRREIESIKRDS